MTTLQVKDGAGNTKYVNGTGDGTVGDPFISDHNIITDPDFVFNETNMVVPELLNGGSKQQAVNGSVTPQTFSYTPPSGYNFVCARIIFYMEGAGSFNSNLFGDQVALINGWQLAINGTVTTPCTFKTNRELGTLMFDLQGSKIYGKEDKTMAGRFTFSKFSNGANGLLIRDGESIATIVNDDLSALTYLEVRVEGALVAV